MTRATLPIRHIAAGALDIAYEEYGRPSGEPIVLLHGFPYDPRCFDGMAPHLAGQNYRVIVPYLRGYGPTRFRSSQTPRSGQQAALASDLIELLDGLAIQRAAMVGYDWGGRAACIAAALWPERVRCLVTGDGYNIQDIARSVTPQAPETEYRLWYQYYLHTQRGRDGLTANRAAFARLLWRLWSPSWAFAEADFAATAASFENPDFVDVVVHSYRHRFGYAPGDPAFARIEQELARQPVIAVPTISLCGADDGVGPPSPIDGDVDRFTGPYERRVLPGVGHNIPQEAPEATLAALNALLGTSSV
jgi:pimeloyl-ACP methyl ester carboxylesterase